MKRLLIIMLIFVLSCEDKGNVENGEVIKKEYQPENTFIWLMPIPMYGGVTLIPMVMYDDEDFLITIKGYSGHHWTKQEKTYCVSKEFYEKIKLGDEVDFRDSPTAIKIDKDIEIGKATEADKKKHKEKPNPIVKILQRQELNFNEIMINEKTE